MRILEIEATAEALPWGVYGGPGARRALEACFAVAGRTGGVAFGLALREWALLAGQGLRSIQHQRDRLKRLGWVRQNPRDRLGRTSRFRLLVPGDIQSVQPGDIPHTIGGLNVPAPETGTSRDANASGSVRVCEPGAGCECPRGLLNHDAFRAEALGDVGWVVLAQLRTPMTVGELVVRTGVDEETLGQVLGSLDGAVTDDDGVLHLAAHPLAALDEIATARGTAGALRADRERFEAEREAFRERGEDA